jgi:hypothetical protein
LGKESRPNKAKREFGRKNHQHNDRSQPAKQSKKCKQILDFCSDDRSGWKRKKQKQATDFNRKQAGL